MMPTDPTPRPRLKRWHVNYRSMHPTAHDPKVDREVCLSSDVAALEAERDRLEGERNGANRNLAVALNSLQALEAERDALEKEVERLKMDAHCPDCCCGASWDALGPPFKKGASIPECIHHLKVVRDSLIAKADALEAENQAMLMEVCVGGAIISAWRGEPVSDFLESFPDVADATVARAQLLSGEDHIKRLESALAAKQRELDAARKEK